MLRGFFSQLHFHRQDAPGANNFHTIRQFPGAQVKHRNGCAVLVAAQQEVPGRYHLPGRLSLSHQESLSAEAITVHIPDAHTVMATVGGKEILSILRYTDG